MKKQKSVICSTLILASFVCLSCSPVYSAKDEKSGVFTPESVLPAGVDTALSTNPYTHESAVARKGTVAATLNNIVLLNQQLLAVPSQENDQKTQKLIEAITALIPSLRVIGVFNLFTPDEWVRSSGQPGRVLAAILYLQKYPQEVTPSLKQALQDISKNTKIKLLSSEIEKLMSLG